MGQINLIRVLLLISNLEYGGAQRQIVELSNNIDRSRFDLHICSLSDYAPLANQLKQGTGFHIIKKHFKFDATVIPRLTLLLRRLNIDIIHSFLFDAEIAARLAGLMAGTRGIIGSERNTNHHFKRRQLLAYNLTRRAVDLIIANSRAGAEFNSRVLGHDMSMYRIIHNGVDTNRFAPRDSSPLREELGILGNEAVVGMFASFKEQKNHPLFFAAAQRVLNKISNVRFLLVGDMLHAGLHGSDVYMSRMNNLVDELGIRDRCLFLGNRDDVEQLYCVCDLTVLPSLFEGTPNALLESMACGIPVVATNISDNSIIVSDNETGYIIPLGDPEILAERISYLIINKSERLKMGDAARRVMEQEFSSEALARKTEAVYETSIASACRRVGVANTLYFVSGVKQNTY